MMNPLNLTFNQISFVLPVSKIFLTLLSFLLLEAGNILAQSNSNQADFSPYIGKVITLSPESHPDKNLMFENGAIVLKTPSQAETAAKVNQFKITKALNREDGFVSFESVPQPGHFLRHHGFVLKLYPKSDARLFKADASFKAVEPLTKQLGSFSFISSNFKDYYLRQKEPRAEINVSDGSALFNKDATWNVKIAEECSESTASSQAQLNAFYDKFGGEDKFIPHYVDAVKTLINAEDKVRAGNYACAKAILDDIWVKYPIGDQSWLLTGSLKKNHGTSTGSPTAYNGLRMLTDVVNYHLNNPQSTVEPHVINMKVVLVGNAEGLMPRNLTELDASTGVRLKNKIDGRLRENNYKLIHNTLYIFTEYITAVTEGKLVVDIQVLELPNLTVETEVFKNGSGKVGHFSCIKGTNLHPVWNAISQDIKEDTDWWWVMYPSFVPAVGSRNQSVASRENFKGYGFITGGKTGDPKGSPVLFCDDLFFLEYQSFVIQEQPSANDGVYTEIEQRCYPPQWFQHEFFHYLYDIFPSFETEPKGFEPTSHDWNNRSFWPADFKGVSEADFYQESMHKRIKKVKTKPLHVRLRHRIEQPQKTEEDTKGNLNLLTDKRDGKTYKTIKLKDGKTWMAENLNFDVGEGCWVYESNPDNGKKYGTLYTWEAAQKACPDGWHVPSKDEWSNLISLYTEPIQGFNCRRR